MSNRHVIFIHGIGPVPKGYSDKLWQDMGKCGDLSEVVSHEMHYSDVFADMNAKITELSSSADVVAWVKNVLGGSALAGQAGDAAAKALRDAVAHVVYFLFLTDPREQVLRKFRAIVKEVLDAVEYPEDAEITIISHSLGTVVAYAGLWQIVSMQGMGAQDKVRVKDLYSLASPLQMIEDLANIPVVKALPLDLPPFVNQPIARPSVQYDDSGPRYNLRDWWCYIQDLDPVAWPVPLKGDFLSAPPVAFSGGAIHAFETYMRQAQQRIVDRILGKV